MVGTFSISKIKIIYYTTSGGNIFLPILIYKDANLDKNLIIGQNHRKSGVYMWKNKVNGKTYVGSAVNLARRLSRYFQQKFLTKQLARGKSAIYKAFLKYDYSNFQVIILEYCEPSNLIKIEQKYIDLHKPEYNLLTLAGSRLGHKVSTESKALIRAAVLGRVLTKETRTRIGAGLGTPVVVMDLKLNNSTSYVSIAEAARSLNTYPKAIWRKVNSGNLHKGRYKITKI